MRDFHSVTGKKYAHFLLSRLERTTMNDDEEERINELIALASPSPNMVEHPFEPSVKLTPKTSCAREGHGRRTLESHLHRVTNHSGPRVQLFPPVHLLRTDADAMVVIPAQCLPQHHGECARARHLPNPVSKNDDGG